ncbi:type II toxin-antitoxin system RelE/ParE family toxin [Caldithrix abyssi]|nr:type II toxin-antitoxin system RelE/ParE family toxin [Caldithrix abyssi]
MDTAVTINDIVIPGFSLHPLKGDQKDIWSLSVIGKWRLTFKFENVHTLEPGDYH